MFIDATLFGVLALLLIVGMFVHAVDMAHGCPHGPDCAHCAREWRDRGDKK